MCAHECVALQSELPSFSSVYFFALEFHHWLYSSLFWVLFFFVLFSPCFFFLLLFLFACASAVRSSVGRSMWHTSRIYNAQLLCRKPSYCNAQQEAHKDFFFATCVKCVCMLACMEWNLWGLWNWAGYCFAFEMGFVSLVQCAQGGSLQELKQATNACVKISWTVP